MPVPKPTDLLGLSDNDLLKLAPEATHQHKKGGLYKLHHHPRDAATGLIARNKAGEAYILYEHLFPYARQFWLRTSREFYDGRFKELYSDART